jgi:hypothetical protein
MPLYLFTYRRDAFETIYVEAEDGEEAYKIAEQKEEEIDWEYADYDVDCIDHWKCSAEEEEDYRTEHFRTQLRGFN